MKLHRFTSVACLTALVSALAACGGGSVLGDPEVLLQRHPVASNAGPMDTVVVPTRQMAALRHVLDASSFLNWAESAYPDLFAAPQSNKTIDVWIYRYYPKTDIYLGTNTSGDVLGLVGRGGGQYDSYPLGKLVDFVCSVYPSDCATVNAAPIANAGFAQNVTVGSVVILDGSASSDANSDPLTYSWTLTSKPAGSTAALFSANSAKPTFNADASGTYVASLTVNDGKVGSNVSTVSVTANVAGTSVSGLIANSTVWTKINSPYVMTGNVLVPGGVTLSIEAGVEVRGANFQILTEGTLNVTGTPIAPVLLTNVAVTPAGKLTTNHFISIVGAIVTGGSVYAPTGNAIYGSLVLTDSRIINGSYFYMWYPLGTNRIERNVFANTGGISYGIDARGAAVSLSIKNNKFIGWTNGYAIQNWAMYGPNVVTVTLNSFLSTDRIAVSLPSGYSTVAFDAANNYWGTTTTSVMDLMIFDRNDDLNSGGVVNYMPILTLPDSATPM